jgi:SRSO17 transposase
MEIIPAAAALTPPPSGQPPLINLAPRDVEALADELLAYHAHFAPLFHRSEQRAWALTYLQGQLADLERKSIEPMALALADGNVQAMQQFISLGAWDDAAVLQTHQHLVAETLGDADSGVLIIDGCDFPKQGRYSVGVARQWCGALGKVANCQASVVACYASQHGYTLLDRQLYMPKQWFTPAYQHRRERCGVPADLTFRTQPELAWELIQALHTRQVVPFEWVIGDEHFGNNPVLLDRIAAAQLCYLMEVPHTTLVWRERPATAVPPPNGKKGRRPQRPRLLADAPAATRVDDVASDGALRWRYYQIQEGAKGPLVAAFAFVRVVAVRDGLPGPDQWLVLRRSLGERPQLKTYLSNAPATTPHATLVRKSGMRWPVEATILECKSELGMDHYEVRGWVGWHHHMTMTLLAHHFLVRQRCRLGKKIGGIDGAASAAPVAGDAAQTRDRRRNGHSTHPVYPRSKSCGLLRPPQAAAAPAR